MLGLSVLFHSWRAAEVSAALVTGVSDEKAGVLSLYVIPADGAPLREVDVPFWDATPDEHEKAASAWRTWDVEADAARAQGRDIPATPDYPQRSWCWPQGLETTGGERADLSHINRRIDALLAYAEAVSADIEKLKAAQRDQTRTAALQQMDHQLGQVDGAGGEGLNDAGGADGEADGQFDRTDASAS